MSTPESLKRHLEWLYGKGGVYGGDGHHRCLCDHAYKSGGKGPWAYTGWVRTTTHPKCPFHGEACQRYWDKHKRWPKGALIDGADPNA